MQTSNRPLGKPLVSIVTASYNAAAIAPCMASVRAQTYPHIEHIVVACASSEGIYAAWNEGLEQAEGEWIAFLSAEDKYLPDAVAAYMELAAKRPEAEYLSSQTRRSAAGGRWRRSGGPWRWPRFQRYMCVAHAGSMHHRRLFRSYGNFDTTYRAAAEYEFLLRGRGLLQAAYLPQVTVERSGAGSAFDSAKALLEAQRAKLDTGGRAQVLAAVEMLRARVFFFARRLLTKHA